MHIERVNCPKLMMGRIQANLLTTGDAPIVEPPRVTPLPAHESTEVAEILEGKRVEAADGHAARAALCSTLLLVQ